MNKADHTPGPWIVSGWSVLEANADTVICNVLPWDYGSSPVDHANAHLLAAAPELLEALKLADAALSGSNMNMEVVQRKVQAAIAKATGEQ